MEFVSIIDVVSVIPVSAHSGLLTTTGLGAAFLIFAGFTMLFFTPEKHDQALRRLVEIDAGVDVDEVILRGACRR